MLQHSPVSSLYKFDVKFIRCGPHRVAFSFYYHRVKKLSKMKLACFLSVLISGQDVEDRLEALEQQVDYNSRELTKLRSRIGDVEYRLEEVITHLNDTVEPRVANNTGSIDYLRHRIESVEDALSCSGISKVINLV